MVILAVYMVTYFSNLGFRGHLMRRAMLAVLIATLTILGPVEALAAQGPGPLRLGFTNTAAVETPLDLRLVESKTHWRTGLIVGSSIGVGLGLLALGGADGGPSISSVVLALTLGAFVGGVPGTLIGGLFPKRE